MDLSCQGITRSFKWILHIVSYRGNLLFICFTLYLITIYLGCTYPAIQLFPPEIDLPETSYPVLSNYNTTWHALKRAILKEHIHKIRYANMKRGIIVLKEETVPIQNNCDCGRIGNTPLTGSVRRKITIRLKRKAPQLTVVKIECTYTTTYTWKDIYNQNVRIQTIPCISLGNFESNLYQNLMKYLTP